MAGRAGPGPARARTGGFVSVRVVAAAGVSQAERAALWTEACSDYCTPGVFTAESLAAFERAFDIDREASRVLIEDDRPVAFAILGLRLARATSPEQGHPAGPALVRAGAAVSHRQWEMAVSI